MHSVKLRRLCRVMSFLIYVFLVFSIKILFSLWPHYHSRKQNKFLSIIRTGFGIRARREKAYRINMWNVRSAAISIGKICAQKVSNLFRSKANEKPSRSYKRSNNKMQTLNGELLGEFVCSQHLEKKRRVCSMEILRRDELIKIPSWEIPFRHHRNAFQLINFPRDGLRRYVSFANQFWMSVFEENK